MSLLSEIILRVQKSTSSARKFREQNTYTINIAILFFHETYCNCNTCGSFWIKPLDCSHLRKNVKSIPGWMQVIVIMCEQTHHMTGFFFFRKNIPCLLDPSFLLVKWNSYTMWKNFISQNLYQQNSNFINEKEICKTFLINEKEICKTFLTGFAKKWLKKFPVHFNNLTSKEWKAVKNH